MIGRKSRRGLGAVNCSVFPDLMLPQCWLATVVLSTPSAAVSTAAHAGVPSPPAPAPAVGPQTEAQMTGAASWTPDQAIAATAQVQKQQMLDFFSNLANQTQPAPDCTNWWTYYTNSACPPDCSRFWTNVTNSACPGFGFGIFGSLVMPLAIAAGVLLMVVVIRR